MNNLQKELKIALAKRTFDIIASGLALLALSPLFLLITLAIKVEGFLNNKNKGPVFYKETRISQGEPFTLIKFRIFKASAYEPIRQNGQMVHTKSLEKNPANLTGTGKILKKFYFDEAPQLWCVFKGDMSLVGTRPWNPEDYEKEISKGILRKKIIRAGLTGPVQLHKLDSPEFGGEIQLDNDYILFCRTHWGLRMILHDLNILIQSLWFMIKGQGL